MSRFIQVIVLVVAVLAMKPAQAFSLLGAVEAWQTVDLGQVFDEDIGGVKNLGEEYRWNTPVITYAYDNSFVNYFGTNGINAIESAIAVYNSLPDLSTLSQTLDEYPLEDPETGATLTFRDSRRLNYSARALGLRDMKSYTMGLLAEQLGLAAPERFMWSLRQRDVPPNITNYLVIMRNFDPVTYMPSRYVNGSRYTYDVIEVDNPFSAYPLEDPADPESTLYSYTSVANLIGGDAISLLPGEFYTYLTRDDIGGLRYIYDRVNLNWEGFPPGTQVTAPDFSSITLLTNLDLFGFSQFTLTNDPATVLAQFPNLVIRTNSSSLTTEVQVVGLVLTNSRQPWDDPFTTNFFFAPVFQTNIVRRYTYEFANVLTNYSTPVTMVRREVAGFEREPWSTPANPIYRTNVTVQQVNLPSGAFVIVPTNIGQFNFTGFAFTNVLGVTNVLFQSIVVENGFPRVVQISEVTTFTNVIYGVYPFSVQAAPEAVLRGGVGEITFVRLTNAVFNGTNFVHTNTYTASFYTNGTLVTNTFTIAANQPDILIGAADLGGQQAAPVISERVSTGANNGWVNNGPINSSVENQGGPGIRVGPVQLVFSKQGPAFSNTAPGSESEEDAFPFTWWGSFDGSTNPPVVYPKDITLEDVELLITGGQTPR